MNKQDSILTEYLKSSINRPHHDTAENLKRMVVYNGVVWKSANALCLACGIQLASLCRHKRFFHTDTVETIRSYLDNGRGREPSAEDVEQYRSLFYRGQYYNSCNSLAEAYGFRRGTLLYQKMKKENLGYADAMDLLIRASHRGRVA